MTNTLDLNSEDYKRYLEVKMDKIKECPDSNPQEPKRNPIVFHSTVETGAVELRNNEADSSPISRCFPKGSKY